jgi:hypothetical protein
MCKNRVLRGKFEPNKQKAAGSLKNEIMGSLSFIRNFKSRRFRWTSHVACIKLNRSIIWRPVVGKPEMKRPFCRLRR